MTVSYILLLTLCVTLAASEETVTTQSQSSATPDPDKDGPPEKKDVQEEVLKIARAMQDEYGPLYENQVLKKQLGKEFEVIKQQFGDLDVEILAIERHIVKQGTTTKRRLLNITERLEKKIVALLHNTAWKIRLLKKLKADASTMQKILQEYDE